MGSLSPYRRSPLAAALVLASSWSCYAADLSVRSGIASINAARHQMEDPLYAQSGAKLRQLEGAASARMSDLRNIGASPPGAMRQKALRGQKKPWLGMHPGTWEKAVYLPNSQFLYNARNISNYKPRFSYHASVSLRT